ncbi:phage tail protein D [uncultured Mediterranean phage uvMED]|nr:phage tail protein D [uncultured Mediterranean phage uvMED]BAR22572.1 phage protein D [uncultured Mediterranean phage uvMED]
MVRLDSEITISGQKFDFCVSAEIISSYNNLLDTARVTIPKKIRYIDQNGATVNAITRGENPLFKAGDEASISVGYDSKKENVFTGYVSKIKQKFPIEFYLEDPMYKLKRNSLTLSYESVTLEELLGDIIPEGVTIDKPIKVQNLGKFRISGASTAKILDTLRREHGIYSFFRGGVLYVGLAAVPKLQKTHRFEFNTKTLINGDKLQYIDASERELKIVCKTIFKDGTSGKASAGVESGEVRTFYFDDMPQSELQATADRLAEEYVYSGFEGYFTTFITPKVNHGDVVELINKTIPEQNGGYLVDKVVTRFGWAIGGKQDIYIRQKVYDLVSDGSGGYVQKDITE